MINIKTECYSEKIFISNFNLYQYNIYQNMPKEGTSHKLK